MGAVMSARRVSILGATGSVGTATLDLIGRAAPGQYKVVALTAKTNAAELARQAIRFQAECVAIADPAAAPALQQALKDHPGIEIGVGEDAVCDVAARDADWTMAAIVGAAGLKPTWLPCDKGVRSLSPTRNAWFVPDPCSWTRRRAAARRFCPSTVSTMLFSRSLTGPIAKRSARSR